MIHLLLTRKLRRLLREFTRGPKSQRQTWTSSSGGAIASCPCRQCCPSARYCDRHEPASETPTEKLSRSSKMTLGDTDEAVLARYKHYSIELESQPLIWNDMALSGHNMLADARLATMATDLYTGIRNTSSRMIFQETRSVTSDPKRHLICRRQLFVREKGSPIARFRLRFNSQDLAWRRPWRLRKTEVRRSLP